MHEGHESNSNELPLCEASAGSIARWTRWRRRDVAAVLPCVLLLTTHTHNAQANSRRARLPWGRQPSCNAQRTRRQHPHGPACHNGLPRMPTIGCSCSRRLQSGWVCHTLVRSLYSSTAQTACSQLCFPSLCPDKEGASLRRGMQGGAMPPIRAANLARTGCCCSRAVNKARLTLLIFAPCKAALGPPLSGQPRGPPPRGTLRWPGRSQTQYGARRLRVG